MAFSKALEELVEIEKKNNQIRREIANVHIANFPFIKILEDFDFDFQPSVNKKGLLEMNTLSFLEKHENILFICTSGVGKTHLATSIGISCAKARNITYFITFENLMNKLKAAHRENCLEARLKFFAKYKVQLVQLGSEIEKRWG